MAASWILCAIGGAMCLMVWMFGLTNDTRGRAVHGHTGRDWAERDAARWVLDGHGNVMSRPRGLGEDVHHGEPWEGEEREPLMGGRGGAGSRGKEWCFPEREEGRTCWEQSEGQVCQGGREMNGERSVDCLVSVDHCSCLA